MIVWTYENDDGEELRYRDTGELEVDSWNPDGPEVHGSLAEWLGTLDELPPRLFETAEEFRERRGCAVPLTMAIAVVASEWGASACGWCL